MVRRVTVDASVLSSVAKGDSTTRAHFEVFRRHDVQVIIPAPVLVECMTGRRLSDARLNVVIGGCRVEDVTEQIARRAAMLRLRAGQPDAEIAAMVVATSELVGGGALLTSSGEVCSALAALTSVRVEVP